MVSTETTRKRGNEITKKNIIFHLFKKYFSKLQGLQASKLRSVCLDDVFSHSRSPPALEGRQTSQSERANKRGDFSLAAKCEIQSSLND